MKIENSKAPIIFLMGPTASGKTALAAEIVRNQSKISTTIDPTKTMAYEIISVDSAMVYQQMNIGSAKPSPKELQLTPHHLIDFIDPKQTYSVSQFCNDAKLLINQIHQRNNIPLLVGGTMLYFKALKNGLNHLPSSDAAIRQQVKQDLDSKGLAYLHQELQQVDAQTAQRLHTNDRQRITRAVEVYRMTGQSLSDWHKNQKKQAIKNPLFSMAVATPNRNLLHQRIEKRFEQMMKIGFLDEVTALYQRGDLDLDCPSMRSVGYRQLWQYLDGELSLNEAIQRAIIATRQLAKRQLTWLRSWPDVEWIDASIEEDKDRCSLWVSQFSEIFRH